jgi:hypothetical protein
MNSASRRRFGADITRAGALWAAVADRIQDPRPRVSRHVAKRRAEGLAGRGRRRGGSTVQYRKASKLACTDADQGKTCRVGKTHRNPAVIEKHAGFEMTHQPNGLPKSGFALEIDGRMKTEFATKEGAEMGAAELKRRFPLLQVRIFDASANTRHDIAR